MSGQPIGPQVEQLDLVAVGVAGDVGLPGHDERASAIGRHLFMQRVVVLIDGLHDLREFDDVAYVRPCERGLGSDTHDEARKGEKQAERK